MSDKVLRKDGSNPPINKQVKLYTVGNIKRIKADSYEDAIAKAKEIEKKDTASDTPINNNNNK